MTDIATSTEFVEAIINNINNGLVRSCELDTLRAVAAERDKLREALASQLHALCHIKWRVRGHNRELVGIMTDSITAALKEADHESDIVKPLEWALGCAESEFGEYSIQMEDKDQNDDGADTWFWMIEGKESPAAYMSRAAAKSAAQADYEARILSALTTDPRAMVAVALERAATIEVTGEPDITPITRHAIRALIDTDHAVALEAALAEAREDERKKCGKLAAVAEDYRNRLNNLRNQWLLGDLTEDDFRKSTLRDD